jgi:hypothetical protein
MAKENFCCREFRSAQLRRRQSRLGATDMGGAHASITAAESVTKLRDLIEAILLGPKQSCNCFNYHPRLLKRMSLRRRIYQWSWAVRPKHRKNFRNIAPELQDRLRDMLLADIVRPGDAADLAEHLTGRLHDDRYSVVPWINAAFSLDSADVVEIGSGAGASTVAFYEATLPHAAPRTATTS